MTTKVHKNRGNDLSFISSTTGRPIDPEKAVTYQLFTSYIDQKISPANNHRNGREIEVNSDDSSDIEADCCAATASSNSSPTIRPILNISDHRLVAVVQLTDKFTRRYAESLGSLKHDACGLTDEAPRETFDGVLQELFNNDINWGRIVALFAFVGVMCVHAANRGKTDMANNYVEWSTSYVNEHLWHWIREHGGWEGLVEFSQNVPIDNDFNEEHLWNSIKNIAKLGAVTVGAYAFVRFMTNRI